MLEVNQKYTFPDGGYIMITEIFPGDPIEMIWVRYVEQRIGHLNKQSLMPYEQFDQMFGVLFAKKEMNEDEL